MRLVSDQLAFDTLLDIHKLFVEPSNKENMSSFIAFDFTNIVEYPNQMLKFNDIKEFLDFSSSDAITATQQWDGMECFFYAY